MPKTEKKVDPNNDLLYDEIKYNNEYLRYGCSVSKEQIEEIFGEIDDKDFKPVLRYIFDWRYENFTHLIEDAILTLIKRCKDDIISDIEWAKGNQVDRVPHELIGDDLSVVDVCRAGTNDINVRRNIIEDQLLEAELLKGLAKVELPN